MRNYLELAAWEIGYAGRVWLARTKQHLNESCERMVHRRSWVPFYHGWKEDDRRIGWSPIATDRRPIWQQNIRRSGALTISSIRLSFVSTQTGPEARGARRESVNSSSRYRAKKIANLLNALTIILREKLTFRMRRTRKSIHIGTNIVYESDKTLFFGRHSSKLVYVACTNQGMD